jgi:serine/threonine protein kinase
MTPEGWRRVDELYHRALDQAPDERAAFLEGACGGDESLRREVESLLAQQVSTGFLASPADLQGEAKKPAAAPVHAGLQIENYKIGALLGEGGMSVVYRAHDTKLNRPVAIKFLSDDLADSAARRRFQQEARLRLR